MASRRALALALGLLLAAALLLPPVEGLAARLLVAHTLRQMLLLVVIGPLLATALAPWATERGRVLAHPALGLLAFNLVLFSWLAPPVLFATSRIPVLEVGIYLASLVGAMCFWLPVVQQDRISRIAKVGYLLIAGVPPTIPGVVLAFSHRVYYAGFANGTRPFGLDPLSDQQLAGLVLFGTAKAALLTCIFVIVWRMFGAEVDGPDDRDEGGAQAPAGPPPEPAWYLRLEEDLPAERSPEREPALGRRPSLR